VIDEAAMGEAGFEDCVGGSPISLVEIFFR
jgi:hypothetical protein